MVLQVGTGYPDLHDVLWVSENMEMTIDEDGKARVPRDSERAHAAGP